MKDLERSAYRQVVGGTLRCKPILVMLRVFQDILVQHQFVKFLLLVQLGEYPLEARD